MAASWVESDSLPLGLSSMSPVYGNGLFSPRQSKFHLFPNRRKYDHRNNMYRDWAITPSILGIS
ncbi:hypothetical protein CPB84DRAFT_1801518 [Gymnopilus junonius]|uniref:Uncharacterized protein n=1 Tax=Gymnopilus junonius TaxID=109634 RepID=A0A9P5N8H9_GYMJU|nr:hypothetical protein CPB84DRAFT_1801518 [Gymnopilus junonius]